MLESSQSSGIYSTEINLIPSPTTVNLGIGSVEPVSVALADRGEIHVKHRTKLRNYAKFHFMIIPAFLNEMVAFCTVIQTLLLLTVCNKPKVNIGRCTHPIF